MLLSHSVTSVGLQATLFAVEIKFSIATRVLYVLHAKLFTPTTHLTEYCVNIFTVSN